MQKSKENKISSRNVLSIFRMTTHNGPGIRTLIQFKGCPLHCVWCSTPESQKESAELAFYSVKCIQCEKCVSVCPVNAISISNGVLSINRFTCNNCGRCAEFCYSEALKLLGKPMTVEELLEEVRKDTMFYKHSGGGVTLSGGEPLLSPSFTMQLLNALKEEGINVGVDTCGYVPWESVEPMLPYIDFFLYDIKHMSPDKHKKLTGADNKRILSNAQAVSDKNVPIYIRIPVIPGCNDSEDNITATCEFARSLPSLVEINLMPLHHLGKARYESLDRPYPIADIHAVTDDCLQKLMQLIRSFDLRCRIVS